MVKDKAWREEEQGFKVNTYVIVHKGYDLSYLLDWCSSKKDFNVDEKNNKKDFIHLYWDL